MHSAPSSKAPGRKTIHLLVGEAILGMFVAATMVALTSSMASTTDVHAAARVRFPKLATQSVNVKTAQPVVVRPARKAPQGLLPVVDQPDITPHHRALADGVLRSLPPQCRESLKNFYVNYDKNAANRGLGGANTIIIVGNVPDDEFRALLIHECGHVTDLGGLRGTAGAGTSNFYDGNTPIYVDDPSVAFYSISWATPESNRPKTKDTDFVSGYAASDPFEDFGEAYAFYALQQKEFERLAQGNSVLRAKYEFMRNVVFAETAPVGDGTFVRGRSVPWDVTKLPYVWHAKK